jgi:hypothetical protein
LTRRRAPHHRQSQFAEQHVLQLLRRVEIERHARGAMRLALVVQQTLRELRALPLQHPGVYQHADVLHLEQHRTQRLLDVVVELLEPRQGRELRPQDSVQPQRDVGSLGRVRGRFLDRHVAKGELFRALAGHVLVRERRDAEVALCQGGRVVPRRDAVQHVRLEHRVEARTAQLDAGVAQHVCVELDVMADLGNLCVLEQRLQALEHQRARQLCRGAGVAVSERHVRGNARLAAEREPDDLGVHVIAGRRLEAQREQSACAQPLDPFDELRLAEQRLVAARDVRDGRRDRRGRCRLQRCNAP